MPKQKRATKKVTGAKKKPRSREVSREVERVWVKYLEGPMRHQRDLPPEDVGPLAGLRFVVAGFPLEFSAKEARARINAAGGSVAGIVAEGTDFVVVGALAGRALREAHKLGVRLIDEHDLLRLCRGRGVAAHRRSLRREALVRTSAVSKGWSEPLRLDS